MISLTPSSKETSNVDQYHRRACRGSDHRGWRGLFRVSLTAVLCSATSVALAEAPVACHPDQEEQIADGPIDLGSGVVSQYLYPGTAGTEDGIVLITDCESGVKITAALPVLPDDTQRTPEEVVSIMRTALESDESFTPDDVIAAMTSAGAPALLRQSTREDCACALFYPDLRGDKEAWVTP